MQQFETPFCF